MSASPGTPGRPARPKRDIEATLQQLGTATRASDMDKSQSLRKFSVMDELRNGKLVGRVHGLRAGARLTWLPPARGACSLRHAGGAGS